MKAIVELDGIEQTISGERVAERLKAIREAAGDRLVVIEVEGIPASQELKDAWRAVADHTKPVCMNSGGAWEERRARGLCMNPGSCCDSMYCEIALETAAEMGEPLARTEHPTLPLMGPDGCSAPPHVRPMCSLHVCCISSLGFKPNDEEWTERYFQLREKAMRLTQEERGISG